MKMSPEDKSDCPKCGAEITGKVLMANKVDSQQEFFCPECDGVLSYTLIKQFPSFKMILHYAGDPKDIYGDEAQGAVKGHKNKPIKLRKILIIQTARAYLNGEMGTKSGKTIPDLSPCTILNVHLTGDKTEVMFDDKSLTAMPTVQIPKNRLLLSSEEIDSSPERTVWAIDTWATKKLESFKRASVG
jgi:hypothetical protein